MDYPTPDAIAVSVHTPVFPQVLFAASPAAASGKGRRDSAAGRGCHVKQMDTLFCYHDASQAQSDIY
jgi:hypothetical protein